MSDKLPNIPYLTVMDMYVGLSTLITASGSIWCAIPPLLWEYEEALQNVRAALWQSLLFCSLQAVDYYAGAFIGATWLVLNMVTNGRLCLIDCQMYFGNLYFRYRMIEVA